MMRNSQAQVRGRAPSCGIQHVPRPGGRVVSGGQGWDWLVGKIQVNGTDVHLKGQVEATPQSLGAPLISWDQW